MRGSLCLALAASILHVSLQGEFQRKLYKDLVKNYNPLERPVANDSLPLTVYFSLSLLQIMDVDEKNQVLTTNIWLQMTWTDHYLQWNASEYPGVKTVRFPDGQIWKPDILLYNRLTAASRNVILLACPMHEQGLGHGQNGCRHGQLSTGSQDTAAIKMGKTPCTLEKGRERGENMHSVLRAVRIGEGASHMLEPDVGCETGEGGQSGRRMLLAERTGA